ncbi:MAG TPA: hypothetical protein VGH27_01260 [Streptosporangiaceae bacterium]
MIAQKFSDYHITNLILLSINKERPLCALIPQGLFLAPEKQTPLPVFEVFEQADLFELAP